MKLSHRIQNNGGISRDYVVSGSNFFHLSSMKFRFIPRHARYWSWILPTLSRFAVARKLMGHCHVVVASKWRRNGKSWRRRIYGWCWIL